MDEMLVAKLWMAGVLGMMTLFGIVALVGYLRAKRLGLLVEVSGEHKS